MSEIRALAKKLESKIDDLDREKSRLQNDLDLVKKVEKIRLKYEGESIGQEAEESIDREDRAEENSDQEYQTEESIDREDRDEELERLRQRMAGFGR